MISIVISDDHEFLIIVFVFLYTMIKLFTK
jgi:hypothetical protein